VLEQAERQAEMDCIDKLEWSDNAQETMMKLLHKHQNHSLTKCQKVDLVGYGENETSDLGIL
jgi:hypothetical protein